MKIFYFLILWNLLVCVNYAFANPAKYQNAFEVNFEEKIPPLADLQKKYISENSSYDKKYDYGWNIGKVFDNVFRQTIVGFGSQESRIPPQNEDALLKAIQALPREHYQYIGPLLHKVPGISEKILNLPGIRETKNKFPTRIAPELKNIENLEFLSPYLYYVLMPEIWASPSVPKEYFQAKAYKIKVKDNPEFLDKLEKLVPMSEYYAQNLNKKTIGRSDLRTPNPTVDSLLTAADVKAFIDTLDKIHEFSLPLQRQMALYSAGILINQWEQDTKKLLPINQLRDVVNPCQRLVQKIQVLGWSNEFQMMIGDKGFNPKTWAYTCDKTIKAYRAGRMHSSTVATLKLYQSRYYEAEVMKYNPKSADIQFSTAAAFVQMHNAPLSDIIETKKHEKLLHDTLLKMNNSLMTLPIASF